MNSSLSRKRLLASSMITSAAFALAAPGAFAQVSSGAAAAPANGSSDTVGEVVVTGSRIPTANLTSVSPVTAVTQSEIKAQGAVNVEDFLNNLPQAFADQGNYVSNGANGTATVNLRGLGVTRTLVLINGKRVQPGDPGSEVADLNFIPTGLIDRVDVLTGGASAVYGSDAVAGVVNFVMKTNFTGVEISSEFTVQQRGNGNQQVRAANAFGVSSIGFPSLSLPSGSVWNGQRWNVTIIGGVNTPDDKGNVEVYFGYTHTNEVLEGSEDYSTCSLTTNSSNSKQQYCGGSSTDATGRLHLFTGPNAGKNFDILLPPGANGQLQPYGFSQLYNFGPLNFIQRPDVRYQAGQFSHYEISKAMDLYSSFMFMDDHSVAQIGPSGSFYSDNNFTIPCNDPLLSSAQQLTICGPGPYTPGETADAWIGRRNVEGGGRTDDIEHMSYRAVIGMKGDIGSGWTYDVSAQYGRTTVTHIEGGYFLNSKLKNALDVVPGPNGPECQSVLSGTDTSCVPYNIWSVGGVTQAALNYVEGSAQYGGSTTEQVVTGSIAGDLAHYGIKSPIAKDGVGVSFGAEYRRESLQTEFDSVVESGDLAGFGGSALPTNGAQQDIDVFSEARIPLVQGVPGIDDLEFEGGYRYSNYSHGGGNSTYKLGVDWQIIPDVRLRASYERAVRAPNVQELFSPAVPGLVGFTDPCAGTAPTLTAAQCYNTFRAASVAGGPSSPIAGISEAQFASAIYGTGSISQCVSAQCGNYSGGNPNLKPEIGNTYTVGFVVTPHWLRGLSITADYFDITVLGAITTLPASTIFNQCAINDNPAYCSLISRYTGGGYTIFGGDGLGFIAQNEINAGALKTNGIDINAIYRFRLSDVHLPDLGSVILNLNGTQLFTYSVSYVGGAGHDCIGYYGVTCGIPAPRWRDQFRVTWNTPWNLQASINWRHIGPSNLDIASSNPALNGGTQEDVGGPDSHIGAYNYIDLSFSYRIKDRYTLRAGCNNLLDKDPPLLDSNNYGISSPPFGNANTYPQVYDPLGRTVFVGLTADF